MSTAPGSQHMSAAAASLRVAVLGPVTVRAGDEVIDLGPPLRRAVLAVLALRVNHDVSRAELIDAVWGEDPPGNVKSSIYTYVSALRQSLEPNRTNRATDGVLVSDNHCYALKLDARQVDAQLFELSLSQARRLRANSDIQGALACLDEGLELWRGPALAGFTSSWAEAERSRLEDKRITAIEYRAELLLQLGRHAELVPDLLAVIEAHPLREHLHGLLMLALHRGGRQAEALEVYQRARARLVEELGIDPGPELRLLHDQILRHDPVLDVRAEPRAEPALVPRLLPHDVVGFSGRTAELAQLGDLLTESTTTARRAVVISAISGAGGVGKTALALHFAHRVADRFPDGQLHVDLRGFDPSMPPRSVASALTHLLDALDVQPRDVPTEVEQQVGLYRTLLAGRRMLVLLDNAATVDQVRPLLPGTSPSLVLITSRNRLDGLVIRDGAHRFTLDVLSPDEARSLLVAILGAERASEESGALSELARLCGYLPLALRVAAERVVSGPPARLGELVAELCERDNVLDALEVDDDPLTAVRAVFSWSYQALKPDVARLFRLLGLHCGVDISAEAAGALVGATVAATKPLLRKLANGHLLEETARDRYRFHDLLRAYAVDRVTLEESAGERAEATRRLLHWYLHSSDQASDLLTQVFRRVDLPPAPSDVVPMAFADRNAALAWCEAERPNLVAAVHAAAGPAVDELVAARLPVKLTAYFQVRTYGADRIDVMTTGAEAANRSGDGEAEALNLSSLGIAYYDMDRFAEAIECYQRALEIQQRMDDRYRVATTLNNLGNAHREIGQVDQAVAYLNRATEVAHQLGESRLEGVILNNLGQVHSDSGNFEEALGFLNRSLAVRRQIGDRRGELFTTAGIGEAQLSSGQVATALETMRRAVRMANELDVPVLEALAKVSLARALRLTGDLVEARDRAREALATLEELESPRVGDARKVLSEVEADLASRV